MQLLSFLPYNNNSIYLPSKGSFRYNKYTTQRLFCQRGNFLFGVLHIFRFAFLCNFTKNCPRIPPTAGSSRRILHFEAGGGQRARASRLKTSAFFRAGWTKSVSKSTRSDKEKASGLDKALRFEYNDGVSNRRRMLSARRRIQFAHTARPPEYEAIARKAI